MAQIYFRDLKKSMQVEFLRYWKGLSTDYTRTEQERQYAKKLIKIAKEEEQDIAIGEFYSILKEQII